VVLIPQVHGIGPVSVRQIDRWLAQEAARVRRRLVRILRAAGYDTRTIAFAFNLPDR
jgi:hypothetical protein